jgi:hypothetical protein
MSAQIVMGSIGWDDEDEHVFLGDSSNDGHTLVRVQLFDGRDHSKPLDTTRAQGTKILCHLPDGMYRIPAKDTRCYVAIPPGMEQTPAGGVIIACVSKSPTTQFAKDRAVLDFGPDVHVVIRGKSVTMQDPEFRFLSVGSPRSGGAPGVQVHLPDGTGAAWQDGAYACFVRAEMMMQMKPDGFEIWQGSGSTGTFLKMGGGEFWSYGPTNKLQGAGCYIGKAPTVVNTAVTGLPQPGVQLSSASVFISVV